MQNSLFRLFQFLLQRIAYSLHGPKWEIKIARSLPFVHNENEKKIVGSSNEWVSNIIIKTYQQLINNRSRGQKYIPSSYKLWTRLQRNTNTVTGSFWDRKNW